MREQEQEAEELIQFLTALRDNHRASAPASMGSEEETFARKLMNLASRMEPERSFVRALERQLARGQEVKQRSAVQALARSVAGQLRIWRQRIMLRKGYLYVFAIGVILLVSALTVAPLLAEFGLEHFVPRGVDNWSPSNGSIAVATIPPESYSDNVEALEAQAGFSALLPQYIPADCHFLEGNYLEEPVAEIRLFYQSEEQLPCFDVVLRQAEAGTVHRPYVGPGSVEEISIKGQRALYISGMWVVEGPIGETSDSGVLSLGPGELEELYEGATWVEGPKQIVFEYGGLLIRITGGANISKAELVKVAESLE